MACYHPLFATTYDRADGKKQISIWNTMSVLRWEDEHHKKFEDRTDFLPLPCGKCIGCRLEYSRQWANRCMLELQYHESSYFVTLTYNDEHLRINYYPDPETGEAFESATLCKRDFQLFMKRLRKKYGDGIRFFAAGEYGTKTFRPHYHAIIFGLKLDDLKPYKRSAQGFQYYTSEALQSVWCEDGQPIGYAVVAPVTWETCAYTARYVVKKLNGAEAQFYSDFNLVPEFSLMSRRPGIARQYYDDHPDLMEKDKINIATDKKGLSFKPPRYYDHLYDLEEPVKAKERKERLARVAKAAAKMKMSKTNLSYLDQLQVNENALTARIGALKRNII